MICIYMSQESVCFKKMKAEGRNGFLKKPTKFKGGEKILKIGKDNENEVDIRRQ